jgi:diaminohydroxyphosphoribosylaminopyrimidine deaminase/5-amino-6-(5-phosphoribosylamino)uracil reductase
MRFDADAILVGSGTLLQDDPSLNVRYGRKKQITKVVLDSQLRTPTSARLFRSGDPVILFHGEGALRGRVRRLQALAELVEVTSRQGFLSWPQIMRELAMRKLAFLHVEGGAKVASTLVKERRINKLALFYGPKLLGDKGLPGIVSLGRISLGEAPGFEIRTLRRMGEDFMVELEPNQWSGPHQAEGNEATQ